MTDTGIRNRKTALDRKLGASAWRMVNTKTRILDFVLGNRRPLSDNDGS